MANGNSLRPAADDQITAVRDTVLTSKTYQALAERMDVEGYEPDASEIAVHTTGNEFIASIPLQGGSTAESAMITIELVGTAVVGGTATIDVPGQHGQSGPTTYYRVAEDFSVHEHTVEETTEE